MEPMPFSELAQEAATVYPAPVLWLSVDKRISGAVEVVEAAPPLLAAQVVEACTAEEAEGAAAVQRLVAQAA